MSELNPEAAPASPCIGICRIDAQRVCIGCFRHIDEIAEWTRASPERRLEIRRLAKQRAADGVAPIARR